MLKILIDLLISIASQKKPVKVEVNYDGKAFHWVVKVSNITAGDFSRLVRPNELSTDQHMVVRPQKEKSRTYHDEEQDA